MKEIKRGSVWWCDFPNELNSRQCGRRPCLVVSNDKCNRYSSLLTVVPMTSKHKPFLLTHYFCRLPGRSQYGVFLFEQVTVIDKSLLIDYIGDLSCEDMFYCDHCLKIQLGLT